MTDFFAGVISTADNTVRHFDHESGAVIRTLGSYNSSFSPYFVTNFDPETGLPLAFAIGATEWSNPCSLAADEWSLYVLDSMACRVLRFDAPVGDLHVTFGGKRGIGSGRLAPDNLRRNIIALANDKIFVTDNGDGVGGSGTGFVVQFTREGVWEADYSIAAWISALSGSATFDQITGFAWDPVRQVYWALAQGTTDVYLLAIDSAGVPTGEVIDLTARLSASLGLTVVGHSDSPALRVQTRGLRYFNSYLYLWTDVYALRVDLTGPSGDQIVLTGSAALAPGHLNADGTELTQALTNAAQGVQMVRVVTLATLTTPATERTYGVHDTFPEDGISQLTNPWDVAVTPTFEDTISRSVRWVAARARVRAVQAFTCSAKAAIHQTVTRTVTARGRILGGVIVQCTARAAIDEPHTLGDRSAEWTVSQEISQASRQFTISAPESLFQVGHLARIKAGYDRERVLLMDGQVDEVSKSTQANAIQYQMVGRDVGARKLETRITKTWHSTPRQTMPRAHEIAREIIVQHGLEVGALEFPDYELHNSFQAIGDKVVDILSQLIEPWNIFGRVRYFPVIRDQTVHVLKLDYANPPANGYPVLLMHQTEHQEQQVDYLDEPRLNEVQFIFIRGAAWTEPRADMGEQTRIEYFRNVVRNDPSTEFMFGGLAETVTTETTVIETFYGDKVLTRDETVAAESIGGGTFAERMKPISRTLDRYFYMEPGDLSTGMQFPSSPDMISYTSSAPSENALLLGVNSRRWGNVPVSQAATEGNEGAQTTFREVFRSHTTYFYDSEGAVSAEGSAIQEFDTDTPPAAWRKTQYTMRTHSPTTGGTLRTQLTNFVFEDSEFQLDSVDVQQVGGSRAEIANPGSRKNLITRQAQAPQGELDDQGNVIDPGEGKYVWSYENPYIGQEVCDQLYQMALDEQTFQLQGFRWERVPFESVLNPVIHVGQPVRVEISDGIFKNYWVMQVSHSFNPQQAMTTGTAWRLTQEAL